MKTEAKKGILFDSTLCIGCGACAEACKERNRLPRTADDFLQDRLSEKTYSTVKKVNGRYVRQLCMHCQSPACASVCPVGALEKTSLGPVVYHEDRCIGCRYCMQACPFAIPKYEWHKVQPRVRKCDLCSDRVVAGQRPACAQVCPTGATKFGDRDALIEEARARIRAHPEKYVNHIYGLEEVGGTSVLLLADLPMDRLGYPGNLGTAPLPQLTWNVLRKVPSFVVVGGVLLGGIWWLSNRRVEVQRAEREGRSGS